MSHYESFRAAVSARLQETLAQRDKSIRWLHQRLDERGAKYSSYGAVRSYVQGERDQPVAFINEAADVLDVRVEWLFLGSGERTAAEQRAAERAKAEARAESGEALLERIAEDHPEIGRLSEGVQGLFLEVLNSYILSAPDGSEIWEAEDGVETVVELAGRLLFLLFLPLRWKAPLGSWGFIGLPDKTPWQDVSNYAVAMLHALQTAIPARGQGQEVEKAEKCLVGQLQQFVEALEEEQERRNQEAEKVSDIDNQRPLVGDKDPEEDA